MGIGSYEGSCKYCGEWKITGDEGVCNTCAEEQISENIALCERCDKKTNTQRNERYCYTCFLPLTTNEMAQCSVCLKRKAAGFCVRCQARGKLIDGDGVCIDCKEDE